MYSNHEYSKNWCIMSSYYEKYIIKLAILSNNVRKTVCFCDNKHTICCVFIYFLVELYYV